METTEPADGSLLMAAGTIIQSTPIVEQELFPVQYYDNGAPFPLGGGAFDQMGIPNPPPSTPPSSMPDGMTPAGTWLLSPDPSTPPSTLDHVWRLPQDIPSPPARSTPSPRSSAASPDNDDDDGSSYTPFLGYMAAYPALCVSACSPASFITSTPLGLISGRAGGIREAIRINIYLRQNYNTHNT